MKKVYLILTLSLALTSCGFNLEQKKYNFDNFKETLLWDLAKAVRADNATEVKDIIKDQKLKIDLKDPKYNQTLLALAIQNEKENAFLALLDAGASPNELVGSPQDATPFIYGIKNSHNCNLFYVENMLKHGANPNLEIKNPNPEQLFLDSFPLLIAIRENDNEANDCLNMIKLLVDNGADINYCYKQSYLNYCEGAIAASIISNSMEDLKYFVIEKKIAIPDTVLTMGDENEIQKPYGLREILNTEDYQFEDFEEEGQKFDRSKQRKIRKEILEYLDKIGK